MQVDVPGGSATLRHPNKIPGRLADAIEDTQIVLMLSAAGEHLDTPEKARAFSDKPFAEQLRILGTEGVAAMRDYNTAQILGFVSEWSFGSVDKATLDELPRDARDALVAEITKVQAAVGGPALDASPSPEPRSPSGPSSE